MTHNLLRCGSQYKKEILLIMFVFQVSRFSYFERNLPAILNDYINVCSSGMIYIYQFFFLASNSIYTDSLETSVLSNVGNLNPNMLIIFSC